MNRKVGPLIFLATVVACDGGAESVGLDVPEDLQELRENALNCSRDVAWTHAERSEHCVLVAENIFDDSENECWEGSSDRCLNWRLVHSDISLFYQGAIAESLFEHGKSIEMAKVSEGEFWRMVYFDGKLMRELFQQCLQVEEKELAEVNLAKVHQVPLQRLRENQRCFRRGYPDFETKPLENS
ncbi:hypothetical protein [Erythrobacter sp. SAORIC-644]|uniref:hypothetical protein n=1 Tax=Erythrobacter sp. SAORIC-644 TaxID=1869314 RepID=UPI0011AF98E2|nr:hypothetical protein [Erythrobacter sp. SAORIC-644]